MNGYKIFISLLIVLLIVGSGVAYFVYKNNVTPTTPNGTPQTNGLPDVPSSSVQTQEAVQSAFLKYIAGHDSDNKKVRNTAISGGYALQVWSGNIMGGQALLKYSGSENGWVVLTLGGGAWSVDGLVEFGVPRAIATALLAGLAQ